MSESNGSLRFSLIGASTTPVLLLACYIAISRKIKYSADDGYAIAFFILFGLCFVAVMPINPWLRLLLAALYVPVMWFFLYVVFLAIYLVFFDFYL